MKLTILGGGGFRVPLIYQQLLTQEDGPDVREVVLYDLARHRLNAVHAVLDQLAAGRPDAPKVRTATDLDEALDGADFVFSAIRVDGLAGRTVDERVALDLGILGQETTGPGGLAYGLRTIPVCLDIADRVARRAPNAWVINFTNPAGMVTEAMRRRLGDRVIGICDSPIGSASAPPGCSASTSIGWRWTTSVSTTSAGCVGCGWTAWTGCPNCWPTTRCSARWRRPA